MNQLEHIICDILPGIGICQWCGSVLNIYLEYHRCLLYSEIADWYKKLSLDTSNCFSTSCPCQDSFFKSLREYLTHSLKDHRFLPLYICPYCHIAFVNPSSVKMHLKHFCEAFSQLWICCSEGLHRKFTFQLLCIQVDKTGLTRMELEFQMNCPP